MIHELALLLALPFTSTFEETWRTPVDDKVLADLTKSHRTEHFEFHYRGGDIQRKAMQRAFRVNEEKFEELSRLLELDYEGRVHVFLYPDGDDMRQRTDADAVAFSTGTRSIHQPVDFESVHELTHIFALQLPKDDNAYTDLFVTEGLATTLAKVDQEVPIASWAAIYASVGKLPSLLELRKTFPDGSPAGVHPYHVAGGFVGYLIERFGIDAVKRWYVNATEAHMVFGETFPSLERDWRASLESVQVTDEHRAHVLAKLGLLRAPMPESYATAKGKALFNGKSTTGLDLSDPSKWKVEAGILVGEHDGSWTTLFARKGRLGDRYGVRVRFRVTRGDAFKFVTDPDQDKVEAIFAAWSTYLSVGGGFVPNNDVKVSPGTWYDAVLVNDRGTGSLFLNGSTVHGPIGPLGTNQSRIGLGIEKGRVEIESFELFDL